MDRGSCLMSWGGPAILLRPATGPPLNNDPGHTQPDRVSEPHDRAQCWRSASCVELSKKFSTSSRREVGLPDPVEQRPYVGWVRLLAAQVPGRPAPGAGQGAGVAEVEIGEP